MIVPRLKMKKPKSHSKTRITATKKRKSRARIFKTLLTTNLAAPILRCVTVNKQLQLACLFILTSFFLSDETIKQLKYQQSTVRDFVRKKLKKKHGATIFKRIMSEMRMKIAPSTVLELIPAWTYASKHIIELSLAVVILFCDNHSLHRIEWEHADNKEVPKAKSRGFR